MKVDFKISPWKNCNSFFAIAGDIVSKIYLFPIATFYFKNLTSKDPGCVKGCWIDITFSWLCFQDFGVGFRLAMSNGIKK